MANVIKIFQGLSFRITGPRNFYSLQKCYSTKPDVVKEQPKEELPQDEQSINDVMRGLPHTPTNFDKRILVFTGRFKTIEDIPKSISCATMDKARNSARIKISNLMILATIIGCFAMAISGKRAAARGESVHQANLDWHKEMNQK